MEALVLARINELLTVRRLYRQNRWSATWSEARKAQDAELRALVRLVRQYRKAQPVAIVIDGPDHPANSTWGIAKGNDPKQAEDWRAWTPAELAEAFGR
jgi:hypothetical protein